MPPWFARRFLRKPNSSDLENLLNALAQSDALAAKKLRIVQEEKQTEYGTPDFTIRQGGLIVGYVENKKMEENLAKISESEQIKNIRI